MIPLDYITAWRTHAPWPQLSQVEQDLIICRALVELYSHPLLAEHLAFRGGTALFKLHLSPARYSEDIDLVQMQPGPIGPVMDAVQEKLNPWLGVPKRKQSEGRVTLIWRVESEEGLPLRLKVEINSREHFTVLGYQQFQYEMVSRWHTGTASISTYGINELLGTKLRVLYQRKKGRDLFDLWHAAAALEVSPDANLGGMIEAGWERQCDNPDPTCVMRFGGEFSQERRRGGLVMANSEYRRGKFSNLKQRHSV